MATQDPTAELHPSYSQPDATATNWEDARESLAHAEIYWLSTVRPDGRPHVTPLIAIWHDDTLYFCTGPGERKAKNLEGNPHCVITTGCNAISEGLDLLVEGDAVRVTDVSLPQRLAKAWVSKYGEVAHVHTSLKRREKLTLPGILISYSTTHKEPSR